MNMFKELPEGETNFDPEAERKAGEKSVKEQLRKEFLNHPELAGEHGYCNPKMVGLIADWWLSHFPDQTDKGWEEWEKKFDDEFDHIIPKILMEGKDALKDIKSFIRNLLEKEGDKWQGACQHYYEEGRAAQRKEMERMVEGMKVNDDELGLGKEYDKALSDLLAKLKERYEKT